MAARNGDQTLAETGVRIVHEAATLRDVSGPFNLFAIAELLRDGEAGRFAPAAWAQIEGPVLALAARIGPPAEPGCFTTPGCYTNWRLVWSAGMSALVEVGAPTSPSTLTRIREDIAMAEGHTGPLAAPSPLGPARELSDPGGEPPAYHLFSCALLELIAEGDPLAITARAEVLRAETARYALELMAPDGQLSYAGRSLDQSWVQAAGADLGARQATRDPAHAAQWRSFSDRAFSYLTSVYLPRPDGILPIVPGLLTDWTPTIMDSYAALDQYEGLTLWFLTDALEHWPIPNAPRAAVPSDAGDYLVGDLHSSGLVWGRSGRVWWAVSGHTTSSDPRSAEGIAALKTQTASGWHDLLALRPQRGASSVWTLRLRDGQIAAPVLTAVHGNGHHATLTGSYRTANGHATAPATWTVITTVAGLKLRLLVPRGATIQTTVWVNGTKSTHVVASGGRTRRGDCITTASGTGCPVSARWSSETAELELG